jgi:hypothetical protein
LFGADQDDEVELDVVHPSANMNGLIPLIATKVKVENATLSITKLVLKQPFVDSRDFADKLIKAELSVDLPGVKITTPTIPRGLRDTKEVKAMFSRDATKCVEEEEAHKKVLCTLLQSTNALTTREMLYTFPENFMCSNSYFNDDNPDPLKLVSKIERTGRIIKEERVQDPNGATGVAILRQTIGHTLCAKWELFLVGSEQRVESNVHNKKSEEDKLLAAMNGMSF